MSRSQRPGTDTHKKLILYTDGGSRGNPGPAGFGAVLTDAAGRVVRKGSGFIGRATNNEAEYRGLIAGLEMARDHDEVDLLVRCDSELLVRQITGAYRVRSARLRPLFERARRMLEGFARWRAEHIRREYNSVADALADQAISKALPHDSRPRA